MLTAVVLQLFREGIVLDGAFDYIGNNGNWWSSRQVLQYYERLVPAGSVDGKSRIYGNKAFGFSALPQGLILFVTLTL
jgi:hypothetical protein